MALLADDIQRRIGLSTDIKPTLAEKDAESLFYEYDTSNTYIWTGSQWVRYFAPVTATMADTASLDAFGRQRVSEPYGVHDNKNVMSRNRNLFEEIIYGGVVTYTGLTGTFTNGEEVRGPAAPIRAIGTIITDDGASSMRLLMNHNDFVVGTVITGQTSGATATVVTTNTGANIEHQYNRASVFLTTSTAADDYAIRQVHRPSAYVPAKGQLVVETFILGAAKTNVTQRAGLFNDGDGLFVEQTGTDIAFVVRSSTSGSPVDTRVAQTNWNIDKLDGTGPSGITLDTSNEQILFIDFQWLGAGSIRYGFNIGGTYIIAHEIDNANENDVVYMRTPTLPIRYEIRNTGVTASPTTLEEICSSVVSEGGYTLPGFEFTIDSDITPRTVTNAGFTPVFAVRMVNSFEGHENRRIAKILNSGVRVTTNDALIRVMHVHDPYDITATWVPVGGGSSLEYSTDITAVTGRPAHEIEAAYANTSAANKAAQTSIPIDVINQHGYISQNYDSTNSQAFVLYAKAMVGSADVSVHMTLIEFD